MLKLLATGIILVIGAAALSAQPVQPTPVKRTSCKRLMCRARIWR